MLKVLRQIHQSIALWPQRYASEWGLLEASTTKRLWYALGWAIEDISILRVDGQAAWGL